MKARLVGYQTHVQDYGTQAYVYDGAMAGTEGECKRMESIRMKLPSSVNSSIQYRSHVQDIGWEKNWASNGSLSGTEGQCKRLEAIQIKLSGDVAENYDVYYRVHVQDYGWLAWAKNGESSGTEGYANVSRQLRFVWFQREQLQTFQHQQMKKPSSKKITKLNLQGAVGK